MQNFLFWATGAANSHPVHSVPIVGGNPLDVATAPFQATAMAMDPGNVYWLSEGSAWPTAKGGVGGDILLTSGPTEPNDIAVDDTDIYWTEGAGRVMKLSKGANNSVLLATVTSPFGIALDPLSVYVTDPGSAKNLAMLKSGQAMVLLADGQSGPARIATHSGSVVWANHSSGEIMMQQPGSGTVRALAKGQPGPWAVAIDPEAVYWTNREGGQVMKVARKKPVLRFTQEDGMQPKGTKTRRFLLFVTGLGCDGDDRGQEPV